MREVGNSTSLVVEMDFDPAFHEEFGAPQRAFVFSDFVSEEAIAMKTLVGLGGERSP